MKIIQKKNKKEFTNHECPLCYSIVLSHVTNEIVDNQPNVTDCGHLIYIGFSNTDMVIFDKQNIKSKIEKNLEDLKKHFSSDNYICLVNNFDEPSNEDDYVEKYETYLIFEK